MSKMNKKAQAAWIASRLIMILLGIAVFVIGIMAINSAFRLGSKAPGSYDRLADTISSIKDGELISMPFHQDDKTAVLFFDKDSDEIFLINAKYLGNFSTTITFPKPATKGDICKNSACIMLCRSFNLETDLSVIGLGGTAKYSCTHLYHPKILDFTVIMDDPLYNYGSFQALEDSATTGGGFFERGLFATNPIEKTREIYVERKGEFVYVCDHYPCASESIKKRAGK